MTAIYSRVVNIYKYSFSKFSIIYSLPIDFS